MAVVVAACQVAPDAQHPGSTGPVEAAVREAAAAGASLVVLPELAVTGYGFTTFDETAAARETIDGPTVAALCRLSAELGVVVVCGVPERVGGRWYNTAVVVDSGLVLGSYRKAHLWGGEERWCTAGDDPPLVVDTAVGRVGAMVCYDLEFPEWVRLAVESGAEILAVPANWPRGDHPGQQPIEVAKAQACAAMYRVHVVVADRCGSEGGIDWEGASLVCGADGYLLAGPATTPGGRAEATTLLAELDPARARDKSLGSSNHALADRRPELYGETAVT